MNRLSQLLPYILAFLLLIGIGDALVFGVQYWWPGRMVDGPTSGVWTALAVDFSQGHLYRPIISEIGYGGTRYMPLYFMYLGALIAIGLPSNIAGLVAMQSTVVAMVAGIYTVLRRLQLSPLWALGFALTTYCTTIYEQYLPDTDSDYLAAALSLFALALYILPEGKVPSRRRLLAIAFICSLGFYTKFTTLYVPAALFLHLVFTKQWRNAALFAAAGLAISTLLFGIFEFWSEGLMWENIFATATNGTTPDFAQGFLYRFCLEIFFYNPAISAIFLMALAIFAAHLGTLAKSPAALVFLMVSLATVLIFTSRGIAGNHVIALHAFSLLMIAAGLKHRVQRAILSVGFAIMTMIVLATWLPSVPSLRKAMIFPGRETVQSIKDAVAQYRHDGRPILTDQGAIPALFGERSVVLDGQNLNHFYVNNPVIATDLKGRIDRKDFSLIIALGDIVDTDPGIAEKSYVNVTRVGRFRIMVPRP